MAKRSRPLGLSKSRKQQKTSSSKENGENEKEKSTTPQLNIELEENENADNVTVQLIGLWNSYLNSSRDSDALLNGIVNECDTLLSNKDGSGESLKKDDQFLAVFALALSELTIFNVKKIHEYFEDSLDIINLFTEEKHTDILNVVESKIIFQRIPLEYISKLEEDSSTKIDVNLSKLIELGQLKFKSMIKLISDNKYQNHKFINGLIIENISIFNDLIDIVENFGSKKNLDEGLDSEVESDAEDENEEIVQLKPNHPLYKIQQNLTHLAKWLRIEMTKFLPNLTKETKQYYYMSKLIGESFLKESEFFSETYLQMAYGDDDDEDDEEEMDNETIHASQKESIELITKAIEYLTKAQDPENADSWAQLAEAYIDLGNVQDNESTEQERSYKEAEQILQKANIASHNKYQYILDNLNSDSLSKEVENTNI
ncbi:enhancer of translation termination 1 [Monosporozyma unispora]|nr:Ihnibitor of Brome mosaic virus [Kazachstania unispora]